MARNRGRKNKNRYNRRGNKGSGAIGFNTHNARSVASVKSEELTINEHMTEEASKKALSMVSENSFGYHGSGNLGYYRGPGSRSRDIDFGMGSDLTYQQYHESCYSTSPLLMEEVEFKKAKDDDVICGILFSKITANELTCIGVINQSIESLKNGDTFRDTKTGGRGHFVVRKMSRKASENEVLALLNQSTEGKRLAKKIEDVQVHVCFPLAVVLCDLCFAGYQIESHCDLTSFDDHEMTDDEMTDDDSYICHDCNQVCYNGEKLTESITFVSVIEKIKSIEREVRWKKIPIVQSLGLEFMELLTDIGYLDNLCMLCRVEHLNLLDRDTVVEAVNEIMASDINQMNNVSENID